jgi:hypothetical protein
MAHVNMRRCDLRHTTTGLVVPDASPPLSLGTVGVGIEACGRRIIDLATVRATTVLGTTVPAITVLGTTVQATIGRGTTVPVGAVASGTAAAGTGDVRTYRASSPT